MFVLKPTNFLLLIAWKCDFCAYEETHFILSLCYGVWDPKNKAKFKKKKKSTFTSQIIHKTWSVIENHKNMLNHSCFKLSGDINLLCHPIGPSTMSSYKVNVDATRKVNNKWSVEAVICDANDLVESIAAITWCFDALSSFDIAETLSLKLTIRLLLTLDSSS